MGKTKIKELRIKNNLTQRYLAKKLNVTPQTILNWENDCFEPNIEQLKKLSTLFNVSIDYIVNNKIDNKQIANQICIEIGKIQYKDFIEFIRNKIEEIIQENK